MSARPSTAAAPRLIKRYDNRKLYDAGARRYVTIEDIARLITAGEDVFVQDLKSGEDITSVVLAQVILDGVKERTDSIPRQVLTRLIRLGAGPLSKWSDWEGPQEAAARARAEAERLAMSVQRILADAQNTVESGLRHLLPPKEQSQGKTRRRRNRRKPAAPKGGMRKRRSTT